MGGLHCNDCTIICSIIIPRTHPDTIHRDYLQRLCMDNSSIPSPAAHAAHDAGPPAVSRSWVLMNLPAPSIWLTAYLTLVDHPYSDA